MFLSYVRCRFARRDVYPNGPKADGIHNVLQVRELVRGTHPSVHVAGLLRADACFFKVVHYGDLRGSTRQPSVVRSRVETSCPFANFSFGRVEVVTTPCRFANVLVGHVFGEAVARVEHDRRAKCVNVIRAGHIAGAISLGNVGASAGQVVRDAVPASDYVRFVYRYCAFSKRILISVGFVLCLDRLTR